MGLAIKPVAPLTKIGISQSVEPAKTSPSILSRLGNFLWEGSIFSLNNAEIEAEKERCKTLTGAQAIAKGAKEGLLGLCKVALLSAAVQGLAAAIAPLFPKGQAGSHAQYSNLSSRWFSSAVAAPILEELVFRGILQNALGWLQQKAKAMASESIQKTSVFQCLISSSARILGAHIPFALAHLSNANTRYYSLSDAAIQAGLILLYPTQSVLYETTGDIRAPIANHIANNGFLVALTRCLAPRKTGYSIDELNDLLKDYKN